jgi:hypothetical protein
MLVQAVEDQLKVVDDMAEGCVTGRAPARQKTGDRNRGDTDKPRRDRLEPHLLKVYIDESRYLRHGPLPSSWTPAGSRCRQAESADPNWGEKRPKLDVIPGTLPRFT